MKSYTLANRVEVKYVFLILLYVISSTNCFKCILINPQITKMMTYVIVSFFFFFVIADYGKLQKQKSKMHFSWIIVMLAFLPFLSSIPCSYYYNQSILSSCRALLPHLGLLVYFYFHRKQVNEKSILLSFFVISMFIFFVEQVFQILNPGMAVFGMEFENKGEIVDQLYRRNGVYRFNIGSSIGFVQICLFYIWWKLSYKYSNKNLFYLFILMASVYLTLTRQVIFSTILAILIITFMYLRRNTVAVFLLAIGSLLLFVTYVDVLFSSFFESTSEDINNTDYIRYNAGIYFFMETLESPLLFFFGHGVPTSGSDYADHVFRLSQYLKYYTSDVGFIGAAYYYGWIFSVVGLSVMLIVLIKYRKQVPLYVLMYMIAKLLTSPMMFETGVQIAILLYVCDLHINNSPLRFEKSFDLRKRNLLFFRHV